MPGIEHTTGSAPMPDMLRPPERDRLIAYLERNLVRELRLGDATATALRDSTAGTTAAELCWTAEAAAAAELLALPALRPRWGALGDGLLNFVLAMGEGALLHRRAARPGCVVDSLDPKDFRVLTDTHEFTGDLSRGLMRQELRDAPGGREVLHTGNLVEFRLGKRSFCLDVEDSVVRFGLVPQEGGGVVLFHESELHAPQGVMRRDGVVATLRYEYTIRGADPRLHLRVSLRAAPGVTLSELRLTTAVDELSGGPPARPIRRIVVGAGGRMRPLPMDAEALSNLHQGPAESLSLVEDGTPGAAAGLHLRMLSAERLRSIKLATRPEGAEARPHWLLTRYHVAELAGGESFAVEEERLLAAGTLSGAERAYAALLADPAPLAGRDPGQSADTGAALNAVASRILFAARGEGGDTLPPEELARLRGWYDRHLMGFFAAMGDAPAANAPLLPLRPARVGLRALAFGLLSLDLMLRTPAAPDAPDYATMLEFGLTALLARQEGGEAEGSFTDTQGETTLDAHAAALLALSRLALRRPADARLAPALRRGLMALRLGPPLHGSEPQAQAHPLLRARRADGRGADDDGIRSARLGLLMRALNVLQLAERAGALPLEQPERDHLQALFDACFRLLRGRVRAQGEVLEMLASPVATGSSAATQAAALMALLSPDEVVLGSPAAAESLAS
jgi:hypothetical protein